MLCYQTRYEDGVFVGLAWADEDPREPGRFVLPGACYKVQPPAYGAGQQARWFDGDWIVEPCPNVLLTQTDDKGALAGIMQAWDGKDLLSELVPMPNVTDTQQATWDGRNWTIKDVPPVEQLPPPVMTDAEKLASIGLTPSALKKLLANAS